MYLNKEILFFFSLFLKNKRILSVSIGLLFFFLPLHLYAGPLEKGFEALKVFDYFNAKELFEKSMKNHPSGAAYGLSIIFYRNDNPFHNIDSAYQYILLSEKKYKSSDPKEKEDLLKLSINQLASDDHKEKISQLAFEKTKQENTVESFNLFIKNFGYSSLKKEALKYRNKLAFENAKKINTAQSYKDFIVTYPGTDEINEAKQLYELTLFNSAAKSNTLEGYEIFVKQYPENAYIKQAEDSIFALSTRNETIEEYHGFIKKYPGNHNIGKAWDIIYTLSTLDFTTSMLTHFLFDYPDYPDPPRVKADLEKAKTSFFLIQQEKKYGYIDSLGKIHIPCSYDWADTFSNGVATVMLAGKMGYINKTGNIIIPLSYEEANAFHGGLAVVKKNGKFGVIHKTGKQILPFEFDDISYDENASKTKIIRTLKQGKYRYYNLKGEFLFEKDFEKAGDFSSGRAYFVQSGKYGFINKNGEIVIPASYDWAENFRNGIARVKTSPPPDSLRKESKAKKGGEFLFGLIDTSGKVILPCEYTNIHTFSEDLVLIAKDKKFGFADASGNIVIPVKYDYSIEMSAANGFQNGFAKIEQNKKRVLIDKTGKVIIPCEYNDIRNFSEDLCAVKKGKWGFIDKTKKQKINFQFESAGDFSKGLAQVKIKNKIGFINQQGVFIIPADYMNATDFNNGITIVTCGEKKGILDSTGNFLIACEMDQIEVKESSMFKLEKNGKNAYYNLFLRKLVGAENEF